MTTMPAALPDAAQGAEPIEYVRSYQPFVVRRTVKWTDCDPAGVVYTGVFVDYATAAFRSFLSHVLDSKLQAVVDEAGVDFPAKAISFVFDSSLRPDDKFDVRVRIAGIRNTTFETEFRGTHASGAKCFTARMTTICVSPRDRQAIRVPDSLRARFSAHLAEPGA